MSRVPSWVQAQDRDVSETLRRHRLSEDGTISLLKSLSGHGCRPCYLIPIVSCQDGVFLGEVGAQRDAGPARGNAAGSGVRAASQAAGLMMMMWRMTCPQLPGRWGHAALPFLQTPCPCIKSCTTGFPLHAYDISVVVERHHNLLTHRVYVILSTAMVCRRGMFWLQFFKLCLQRFFCT